jgi:hypothetical protein
MSDYVIGLVTIYHPDEFLRRAGVIRSSADLITLSHRERLRSDIEESKKDLEARHLITLKPTVRDGIPVVDGGDQARRFYRKSLLGAKLAPYLVAPRLIRTPDEPPPRPKWKAECRKEWPDVQGRLEPHVERAFIDEVGKSDLQVRGVWVNKRVDAKFTHAEWVNLVVGPLHEQLSEAKFRIYRDGELHLHISWQ